MSSRELFFDDFDNYAIDSPLISVSTKEVIAFRGWGDKFGKSIDMAAYIASGISDPCHYKKCVVEIKIMIIIKFVVEWSRKQKEKDE